MQGCWGGIQSAEAGSWQPTGHGRCLGSVSAVCTGFGVLFYWTEPTVKKEDVTHPPHIQTCGFTLQNRPHQHSSRGSHGLELHPGRGSWVGHPVPTCQCGLSAVTHTVRQPRCITHVHYVPFLCVNRKEEKLEQESMSGFCSVSLCEASP